MHVATKNPLAVEQHITSLVHAGFFTNILVWCTCEDQFATANEKL